MLSEADKEDQTYEEWMAEALSQIPLYAKEWTNQSPSDPGITILESLTAFSALQRAGLKETSKEAKIKLLQLAGIQVKRGRAAKAYLRKARDAVCKRQVTFGQKLYSGGICYECAKAGCQDAQLTGISVCRDGETIRLDALLGERGLPAGIPLFGGKPSGGEEISLFFQGKLWGELLLYVEAEEEFERNPFLKGENPFVKLDWRLFFGGRKISVQAEDETCGFLKSGAIRVRLPEAVEGRAVLSARLSKCAYDMAPRVRAVTGPIFDAVQTDTRSLTQFFDVSGAFETGCLRNPVGAAGEICDDCFLEVYAKAGEDYLLLREGEAGTPLSYSLEESGEAGFRLKFQETFPYKEVMALIYAKELSAHRALGTLLGYDGQEFRLPPWGSALTGCIRVAVSWEEGGQAFARLFSPEETAEGAVSYTLNEDECALTVSDCGDYEGARLFLADYALYAGAEGTVRTGAAFTWEEGGQNTAAYVCGISCFGRKKETFQEASARFLETCLAPEAMVTKEDCEWIARQVPGLSIDKVCANVIPEKYEIHIAMKPNSAKAQPALSKAYQREAERFLRERRLLSMRVTVQGPFYVPIRVHAALRLKSDAADGDGQVRKRLKEQFLDGQFGETVRFDAVYQALATLSIVEDVLDLTLAPENEGGQLYRGHDIRLRPYALCCPGEMHLELY